MNSNSIELTAAVSFMKQPSVPIMSETKSAQSLVMTSDASFSAWIYPTGPGSPNIGGTIVNKEGEYEIVRFPDGTIQMAFANGNPGWNWINTGYVAPLNEWTHVTVTYSNGTVKTYANGNLVHTYNGAGAIGDVDSGQNDFRIGGRQLVSQNFQGRIDEVRVYDRALTAGEASSIVTAGAPVAINWLVTDHLGTPRMIFDQTGSLANVKRHDYLPFGEELFAGTSGRTTAQGYASGDGVRQQFTSKERDVETGLDYFQARYYASAQGRFTGTDPYEINLERQYASDRSEGDVQLQQYIKESQRWNRYTYAVNNPLKNIDPDGWKDEKYTIQILGENFNVSISEKITDETVRANIKKTIQEAADRINNGYKEGKITEKEAKQIRSLNGIRIVETTRENQSRTGLHQGGIYQLTAHRIQTSSVEFIAAEMVHESFHTKQWNYNCDNAVRFEKEASDFTLRVVRNLGFGPKVIEAFNLDALRGHTPCVKPDKNKKKSGR